MKIIKSILIKSTIIISFLGILLSITGCNNKKIYYFDEVISTSNIQKVDFKMKNEEDFRMYSNEYTTLTNSEINWFIINLKRDNLKYTYSNNNKKALNDDDIFIITYEDGSKTIFDNYHILKKDKNDKEIFNKKITPYNCVIGQNIFIDETDNNLLKNKEAIIKFEKDGYLYTPITKYSYYKTINDYKTNDFFNITYHRDGKIIDIFKSEYNYNNQQVYPIKYDGYEYDKFDPKIRYSKQETIYMISSDYVTPIETTKLLGWYDEDSLMVRINLYTGEREEYKYPFPS